MFKKMSPRRRKVVFARITLLLLQYPDDAFFSVAICGGVGSNSVSSRVVSPKPCFEYITDLLTAMFTITYWVPRHTLVISQKPLRILQLMPPASCDELAAMGLSSN